MKPFEKYLPVYQKALEQYESEHPHWRIEALVSLIKWSLKSLKHYIEDIPDSEISWESPFVELPYAVDWNWKGRGTGDVAPGGHVFGKFTARNTATKKLADKTLSQTMAHRFSGMTLAEATNWAWYEKLNDYYTPVLPVELSVELSAIKSKRHRRERFEEMVRPFSIGAARINSNVLKLKSGARIPKSASNQRMDISGVRFTGDVNGRKFDMGLVFEIHPLIADYDQKKAFHPILVGLAILNGNARLVRGELVQDTPATWPKSDRMEFWEGLLREMEKLTGQLIPKTESQESVIISVNSTLKIPVDHWRPENRSAEIKKVVDALAQIGEVDEFQVKPARGITAIQDQTVCEVCGWIHDIGFTQIKTDQGDVIQLGGILPDIVALVHRTHAKGLRGLNTKDEQLLKICGGYRHPSKAFDDLKHRNDYQLLFNTRKRGFISLRGADGINRKLTRNDDFSCHA
jgi:hypothetical protein